MSESEVEVKKYRERIDEMKKLILRYGGMPTLLYALKTSGEESTIWVVAYEELKREGKVPTSGL